MLSILILLLPALAIRYYLGRPVSKIYAVLAIFPFWIGVAYIQFQSDPNASTAWISAGAVVAYFGLTYGNEKIEPSDLSTITIEEIAGQMWTFDNSDLSEYLDMTWMCAHTGNEYTLRNAKVFLNGSGKRLLLRPPDCEYFSVVRIRGTFRQRLVTEKKGPSKKELQKNRKKLIDSEIIPSGAEIP